MTAIIGSEALINSQQLTYQTANPSVDIPLTPNHYLHGQIGGQFTPASDEFNLRKSGTEYRSWCVTSGTDGLENGYRDPANVRNCFSRVETSKLVKSC